jgi:hypothetical protein
MGRAFNLSSVLFKRVPNENATLNNKVAFSLGARNQTNPSLTTEAVVGHRRGRSTDPDSLTQTCARNNHEVSNTLECRIFEMAL